MSSLRKLWYLYKLRRNVWLRTEELLKIQEKKLGMIVKHAYDNVAYYHHKFKSLNLKPSDIKRVEDLQKLPPITKEEIRKNFPEKITAKNINTNKCKSYFTSGSTGIPLTVLVDPKANDYRAALFGRAFFECGLKLRDRTLFVGDSRHFPKDPYWFQRLGILQRKYFSAAEPIDQQFPKVVDYSPEAIFAYASYLFLLAKENEKRKAEHLHPRLVFSTAEVLGSGEREIVTSLGGEIFDLYGCVETERLAWECNRHEGYHMDIDSSIIEFVKENEAVSAGEEGKMLLTCLYNYAMPLIRYDIGDIGIPTDAICSCGRGFPLIKKILGRHDDFITCPNGRMISPIPIRHAMRSVPGIMQYKVVQKSRKELEVFVVKDEGFSNRTFEHIREEVGKVVGRDLVISPSVVEKIEKEKSGKLRAIVSLIHRNGV